MKRARAPWNKERGDSKRYAGLVTYYGGPMPIKVLTEDTVYHYPYYWAWYKTFLSTEEYWASSALLFVQTAWGVKKTNSSSLVSVCRIPLQLGCVVRSCRRTYLYAHLRADVQSFRKRPHPECTSTSRCSNLSKTTAARKPKSFKPRRQGIQLKSNDLRHIP